jgi:23S rRNA G2069 N7-methylase RlmK/C1962 C5-methylase RlmI
LENSRQILENKFLFREKKNFKFWHNLWCSLKIGLFLDEIYK